MLGQTIYYKEKTPRALNDALLGTSYFKDHWKLIPTTYRLLNRILEYNLKDRTNKPSGSEITYKVFANLFGRGYTLVIQALEEAGLIIVTRRWNHWHCYQYLLTSKAHTVLKDSNKEYLHVLLTDPKEWRRNQIRISKRGYNKLQYGDVRDSLKRVIDSVEFSEDDVLKVVDKYTDEKAAHVLSVLMDIVKKDYSELKYNESDNRVWTPYGQLPAEIKAVIKLRGLEYLISGDIRSCYPSCWARYVLSLAGNPDALKAELERYEAIFLNGSRDPKTYLSELLGINRSEIKEVLIKYFNGHKVGRGTNNPFRKFDLYLQSNFPLLYSQWQKSDIKQTGNNIGRMFETKLMLDGTIYAKARSLGLVFGYEYDGFSLYGHKDGSDEKVNELLAFIEQRSEELLGFKLVLVRKDNEESLLHLCAMTQIEHLQAEIAENDKRLRDMRVSNHKLPESRRSWTAYYALKDENQKLVEQLHETTFKSGVLN